MDKQSCVAGTNQALRHGGRGFRGYQGTAMGPTMGWIRNVGAAGKGVVAFAAGLS